MAYKTRVRGAGIMALLISFSIIGYAGINYPGDTVPTVKKEHSVKNDNTLRRTPTCAYSKYKSKPIWNDGWIYPYKGTSGSVTIKRNMRMSVKVDPANASKTRFAVRNRGGVALVIRMLLQNNNGRYEVLGSCVTLAPGERREMAPADYAINVSEVKTLVYEVVNDGEISAGMGEFTAELVEAASPEQVKR